MVSAQAQSAPGSRVDWSGIYIGLHAGGGWSSATTEIVEPPALIALMDFINIPTSSGHDLNGFLVGGHAGLQGQFGQFVIGIEASFTGGRLDGSSSEGFDGGFKKTVWGIPVGSVDWEGETTSRTEVGEIFMATGRLGYASGSWLTYVKGGYATAEVSHSSETGVDVTACLLKKLCGSASGGGSSKSDARHHGWVIGGGFEYMFAANVSFGIEYNYIDLGGKTHDSTTTISVEHLGSDSFGSRTRVDLDAIHTVYARLSFKVN